MRQSSMVLLTVMDTTNAWLWYRGLRMHLGKWRKAQWKVGQRRWRKLHPEPKEGYTCALCGYLCRPLAFRRKHSNPSDYDFTLDHIIPTSAILGGNFDLDPSLLWHPSNLQAAHHRCNGHKGSSQADNIVYVPPRHTRPPGLKAELAADKAAVL